MATGKRSERNQEERAMGVKLYLESDTGTTYRGVHWFTASDTKYCCDYLSEGSIFRLLEQMAHVNTAPLLRVQFGSMGHPGLQRFASWEEYSESKWQPPHDVITCLETLLPVLEQDNTIFAKLEQLRQESSIETIDGSFETPYFLDGGLYDDLADLLRMVKYAVREGAKKIRLSAV